MGLKLPSTRARLRFAPWIVARSPRWPDGVVVCPKDARQDDESSTLHCPFISSPLLLEVLQGQQIPGGKQPLDANTSSRSR
jgi:hypothetical protein